MKKEMKRPSDIIEESAKKIFMEECCDPGFYQYRPDVSSWIKAILEYLDSQST